MDATAVIEKILSDARNEAERIKREADEKEAAEESKFRRSLEEYGKQTESLAEKAGEEKKAHLLAAARMEIAKQYLAEKGKILDEVFAEAQKKIQTLPDKQYCELFSELMLKAVETGDEEVIVDSNERRINQEFIDEMNRRLSSGRKGNLKLSGERHNIGAGLILRRGRIQTNVSLQVLLAQAHKDLEIELAKELFGN